MADNTWEGWKRSKGKLVQTPDLSAQTVRASGGTAPTLSAQEVQQAVNQGSGQLNNPAAGLTLENQAAQNAATNLGAISGMGNTGRGNFYGTIGAGGQITDPAAFLAAAPGAYNSPYAPAMQNIMNGLLSQKPFQYDVNADGLYQQIKDNYVKQGRQAMMDTQGQSAALTGGYGNSYGVTAGQQAYQESLGNLAGMIPELQQLAFQQYQQDQDAQRNNLEALNKLDQQDYARWADEQAAYQELLKTMPAMAQGMMTSNGNNGGVSARAIAEALRGKADFTVDPNMQMALADYVGNNYGTVGELSKLAAKGYTLKDVPLEQLNYFVNQREGRATGDPSKYGYTFSNPSGVKATPTTGNGSTGNKTVNKNKNNKALND